MRTLARYGNIDADRTRSQTLSYEWQMSILIGTIAAIVILAVKYLLG